MAETRTVTTPVSGTLVELKTWITGGEDEDIQSVIEESLNVNAGESGQGATISGSVMKAMRHKALSIVVVQVGEQNTDVVTALRGLPRQDYKFICAEVDKTTEGIDAEKKA